MMVMVLFGSLTNSKRQPSSNAFQDALDALSERYPKSWSYRNDVNAVDEAKIAKNVGEGIQILPILVPKAV